MTRTALTVALFALIACYFLVGIVGFAVLWPVKTMDVKNYSENNPIVILNKEVRPGDRLIYELDYCKYTEAPAIVHRTLIDGQIVTLTDTKGALPMGCHKTTVATAVVPETINPGRYYLDVTVEYQVNILHSEHVHYHTDYFTVSGKPRVPLSTEDSSYSSVADRIINSK